MKIAVVFDTPARGWEDADFKKEIAAEVYEPEYDVADALMENGHEVFLIGFHDNLRRMLDRLEEFEPELVFNCTESFMGKARYDYGVAALLEMKGYRYTGSPPEALLLARDKATSKKILSYHRVRVPRFHVFDSPRVEAPTHVSFPLIVKPMHEDASVGISQSSVVADVESLNDRVAFIQRTLNQPAIAEELIEGRELYVGMVGNHETELLPTIEITFDRLDDPKMKIATYAAKWDSDYRGRWGIKNIFARRLGAAAREEMERAARTAFQALGLRDYARIDFRVTRDQKVYLLEANPNPFIAFGEDMSNAAERLGMDYYDFIERIVEEAIKRYEAT